MTGFYPAPHDSSFLVPQKLLAEHCWPAQLPEALQHSFLPLQLYVQTPSAVTLDNLLVSPTACCLMLHELLRLRFNPLLLAETPGSQKSR